MSSISPIDVIEAFADTYVTEEAPKASLKALLHDIEWTKNPAIINDIYRSVNDIKESNDFKTNFADANKNFIGYVKRKSNTEKAIYFNYIWKKTKKNLTITGKFIMFKSGAKMPYEYKDGIPKYQTITIARAERNEIEGGDYVPKKCLNNESQAKEDEKMRTKIDGMEIGTAMFSLALDICSMELEKINKVIIQKLEKDDKIAINLIKQAKKKFNGQVALHGYQQKIAEDKDNNKEIKLKYPINRIRISIDQRTGKVGYQGHDGFVYTISDARKMIVNKSFNTPIPARVKVNGEMRDLDYKNSKSFIKYKSNSNLVIHFEGSLSTFGLSVNPKVDKAFISTHRTKIEDVPFKVEDMDGLDNGENIDDIEASDDEVPNKKAQSQRFSNKNTDGDATDQETIDVDSTEESDAAESDAKNENVDDINSDPENLFNDKDIETSAPVITEEIPVKNEAPTRRRKSQK